MVRKSKQASGNATLTHYERRHKLTTDHGTLERRLAGHAQYQLGDCGLSLAPLMTDSATVLCSPSGYLYEDQAILQYLITQTQQIKEQIQKAATATADSKTKEEEEDKNSMKRKSAFESSQHWIKKKKPPPSSNTIDAAAAKDDLRRTSYWLAEAQPVLSESASEAPISTRPLSPHSQQPLRRKDLWPVQLDFEGDDDDNNQKKKLVCAVTGKPIRTQAALAYWTTSRCDQPGLVVLEEDAFNQLIVGSGSGQKNIGKKSNSSSDIVAKSDSEKATTTTTTSTTNQKLYCPCTNQRIRHIRTLQRSGSSFATSGQATVVQKYRPTMT